ncbi:DUF4037 domain-containing protein [Catenulispora yoronensis]|uniref:DUF4037 domain-containing protein n=1 Tax=Catenulispora yoronensis TaxID=450799 RepID=A0ABN2UW22_9ACTN
MSEPEFVPGLELSRRFYQEAVRPIVEATAPGVEHSAARLGGGSEVLGFDTARSADHEWGPRTQLFLSPGDLAAHGERIWAALADQLPKTFLGYPTNFAPTGAADTVDGTDGLRYMRLTDGPVHHRVEIADVDGWLTGRLGFTPSAGVTVADWLATPTQRLVEVTAGAVFHDGLGQLEADRERLAWYPRDLWRYVLACQWQRISQEEAFVGRCGEVGDELGSAVVTARLVRDLMRLVLLMERRYPPYSKWLGSAFGGTVAAVTLSPYLLGALAATDWKGREAQLVPAYEHVAAMHNALGLAEPQDPATRPYYERPFRVIGADRFARALFESVSDPGIRALPPTGAVDQFADSTDFLGRAEVTRGAYLSTVSTR